MDSKWFVMERNARMLNENTEWINGEDLEQVVQIHTISTPEEGQYPFIHELVKGDWIEVNDDLLIDSAVLPYLQFIKKNYY